MTNDLNPSIPQFDLSLETVISTALQIPGVKVNRKAFLCEQFKHEDSSLVDLILKKGPVHAGCPRKILYAKATSIVSKNTLTSTGASFVAGLPGGFAMAAAIPADLLQFYAVELRTAQEISYLYGAEDLWSDEILDSEKVTGQLILYCGVMLGASGAAQAVRVLSSSLAQKLLRQLPQKALTKTFYYPIIKSIAKAFGVKMTKNIFAKGVSKVVPVLGGIVSGGITFATMKPMGMRLVNALDEANFNYTETTFEADWQEINKVNATVFADEQSEPFKESVSTTPEAADPSTSVLEQIEHAKQMLDDGTIDQDEYNLIKHKFISQL